MTKKFFGRRKCVIKFEKAYQDAGWDGYYSVTDAHIMRVLYDLRDKYGFEIVSVRLLGVFHQSVITIRCKKEDKDSIVVDFSERLGKHIEKLAV